MSSCLGRDRYLATDNICQMATRSVIAPPPLSQTMTSQISKIKVVNVSISLLRPMCFVDCTSS